MEVLVLRLEAPLMSFGDAIVDQHGKTRRFPSASMLTGLLGNALGYDHADGERLNRLQQRLRFSARLDRRGTPLRDYQTVDFSQDFLNDTGWTTWGIVEHRESEDPRGTHIRYRDYLADCACTVVLTLDPADECPRLGEIEQALREPARPLFLGRKGCLPAVPVLQEKATAPSLLAALESIPCKEPVPLEAWWPPQDGEGDTSRIVRVSDERDWVNQIHCSEREIREGMVTPKGVEQ